MYRSGPSASFKPPRPASTSSDDRPSMSSISSVQDRSKRVKRAPGYSSSPPVLQSRTHSTLTESLAVGEIQNNLECGKRIFVVQWRKKTTKKNKTWDGDGELSVLYQSSTLASLSLKDSDGKLLSKRANASIKPDHFDSVFPIGQFEVMVDYEVDRSGSVAKSFPTVPDPALTNDEPSLFVPMVEPLRQSNVVKPFSPVAPPTVPKIPQPDARGPPPHKHAIVLPAPPCSGTQTPRPVMIDPHLGSQLRPHQVEGVKFMYECIMGIRSPGVSGCLLADEMGLGKTLMTITLIWTVMKQNPWLKSPLVSKVLICCPVTLINNWSQEFRKWLGRNKVGILSLTGTDVQADKQSIANFGRYNVYQILLVNYEKVTLHHAELSNIKFDLLICDEGHRLKNSNNKVLNHLVNLSVPRKIMLTGTPIQNDLVEFHTIADFINPGFLGTLKQFQKDYIQHISRSRDVNCVDPRAKAAGKKASRELIQLTKQFTIRRTLAVLAKFLTTRTDVILFVAPTSIQRDLYEFIILLSRFRMLLQEDEARKNGAAGCAFGLINLLKKLCNAPALILDDKLFVSMIEEAETSPLAKKDAVLTSSGKINVLIPILLELVSMGEKIVLVSNYTKTLDMLELILKKLNLVFSRLDGSTPNAVRGKLVNDFNSLPNIQAFLLSSKSGGMGINLIGASRLVLFDSDWNPAVDLQSMARIHRDGQKKPCFIYRILMTGGIDEKIFQRQLMKRNLSSKFIDNDVQTSSDVFDYSDMKDIFTFNSHTNSNTHDLLECKCVGNGDNDTHLPAMKTSENESELEDEDLSTTQSWMSAREFQNTVSATQTQQAAPIQEALGDYKHFNTLLENISQVARCISDPIIANIVGHKAYNHHTNKLPITFAMIKENECLAEA